MLTKRIIPCLDVDAGRVVKGISFVDLRDAGDPAELAARYNEEGGDELVFLDITASSDSRDTMVDVVRRVSEQVFIPLTVGGGIRSVEDVRRMLRAGADKVSLNTAAIARPELIREAARRFGSSTVVVSIEAIRQADGTYEAFTNNGRDQTRADAMEWALRAAELGAGEIIVTSIDLEGTGQGFDLELTRKIAESVSIPVIACGGGGKPGDVYEAVTRGKADAVCVASLLHYNAIRHLPVDVDEFDEGNVEYLRQKRRFSKIQDATIREIKTFLMDRKIDCRLNEMEAIRG